MFGKTAIEFWQSDPEIADKVEEDVTLVKEAFREVVERGQKEGDIIVEHDPESIAHFLTGIFYGLQVMAVQFPIEKDYMTSSLTLSMYVTSGLFKIPNQNLIQYANSLLKHSTLTIWYKLISSR